VTNPKLDFDYQRSLCVIRMDARACGNAALWLNGWLEALPVMQVTELERLYALSYSQHRSTAE
jgi:hypothetical protein